MLYTDVLGRNHLAVEHNVLRAVSLVVFLDESEDALNEVEIIVVWSNLQTHELGSLYESVDSDGEILAAHVDVTGVEQRQHAILLQLLEVLVVCELYLMAEVDDAGKVLLVVELVVYGILNAAVQVDCQY